MMAPTMQATRERTKTTTTTMSLFPKPTATSMILLVGITSNIEGVADLTYDSQLHVVVFYEQLILQMVNAYQSYKLMTKEKFLFVKVALLGLRGCESIGNLRDFYPNVYKRKKRFALIICGESVVLVA